jgi:50S ribosomal protein L16 3-hydroxylase
MRLLFSMRLQLPDNLSTQDFLDQYWQKKPLLMRNALQDYTFDLSPEELAGLACEQEVESRMVLQRGENDWELRHGPFDESTFAALPETHWTLLVQDVDKYIPSIAALMKLFYFIPSWRFDDIMISYAVTDGSVGPHTDTYDVFLIQAQGRRRWQIGNLATSDALLPNLPVRILEEFESEAEWTLEPGDVLYLPPGMAHWGIAEDDDCMTWSVGLRAPSVAEMLDSFAQYLLEQVPEKQHFQDSTLKRQQSPSQIQADAFTQIDHQLGSWLNNADLKQRWFGCFSTEVKEHLFIDPPESPVTTAELLEKLQTLSLRRHPFSRFAWATGRNNRLYLFACGELFELPPECSAAIVGLCDDAEFGARLFSHYDPDHPLIMAATELFNRGWLEFEDD